MFKRTGNKLIIVFLVLAFGKNGYSQDSSNKWTLTNCIQYALTNNLLVKKSEITVNQSKISYKLAKAAIYPSLRATAGESFTSRNTADLNGNYSNQNLASGNYALNSNMTIYNGNVLKNNIKLQSLEINSNSLRLEESKNNIEIAVTQAYMQVLFAREELKLAAANEEASKLQLQQYKNLFDAGSIAENDYAQLQSQYSSDHYKFITAQSNLSQQLLTLKQLLELDYTSGLNLIYPDINDSDITRLLPEKNKLFTNALDIMPQLKYSQIDIQMAELDYRNAKAGLYPTVSLSAGISTGYASNISETYATQLDHSFYKNAGISVSLPIYANRQTKSTIEKAKYNIDLARLNYQENQKNLLQNIETTYLNAETAIGRFNAAIVQLKAAEFSYNLADQKFKAGLTDAVALVNAKTIFLTAQQEYLLAKYSAILNAKLLDFYQGKAIELK